jgi:salicylate hydroxylase
MFILRAHFLIVGASGAFDVPWLLRRSYYSFLILNRELANSEKWKLRVHSPIPTWIHGSIALIGDACHPTLPHLAQGAAQAIEDAAALAVVLDLCPDSNAESINKSLKVYEKLRKERAETLVELAAASGRALHLGDGKAKAERDKQFAALKEKKGAVPDKWADADVQKKIYGHDIMKVSEETFAEIFAGL